MTRKTPKATPKALTVSDVVAECKRLHTLNIRTSSVEEQIQRAEQEGWVKDRDMDADEVSFYISEFVESRQQTTIWNAAREMGTTFAALLEQVNNNWGR